MNTDRITVKRSILAYQEERLTHVEEVVATEFPLTIILNEEEFATMVCTPAHIEEMVVGFLASEGIIHFYEKDIKSLEIDTDDGFAYVELTRPPALDHTLHSKRFLGSCCGKSRQSFYFLNDVRTAKTAMTRMRITPQTCLKLMQEMETYSHIFKETGGVHNAALCDQNGVLIARTDIGRHNALDKLYGHCLIKRMPVRDKILTFSGRISSEILLKAAKIGVGIVLSKSAPTELALQLADELHITTVGFIRRGKMNIYTHPQRIAEA